MSSLFRSNLTSNLPLVTEFLLCIVEVLHGVDGVLVEWVLEWVGDDLCLFPFTVWQVELMLLHFLGHIEGCLGINDVFVGSEVGH